MTYVLTVHVKHDEEEVYFFYTLLIQNLNNIQIQWGRKELFSSERTGANNNMNYSFHLILALGGGGG